MLQLKVLSATTKAWNSQINLKKKKDRTGTGEDGKKLEPSYTGAQQSLWETF